MAILEAALNPMRATLTPEEKKTYGSVNEKNKLINQQSLRFSKVAGTALKS